MITISFTFIGRADTTTEDPTTTQHDVTSERLITTPNDYTTTTPNTDIICTTPICILFLALLIIIALFIIVCLIVLLVLCCTGRLNCNEKNTSKTSIQNSNNKDENRQTYKAGFENEHRINKGDMKNYKLSA